MSSARVIFLTAAAALFGCQAVTPETQTAPATTVETPAPAGPLATQKTETLLALLPAGWIAAFASNRPGVRLAEYVPAGDTNEAWVEKMSFESFDATPLPDPIDMLIGIARDQKETCPEFTDRPVFSGTENGYATSIRLFVCRNNPITKQGQVTLVKAIRGNEQFYVITRAKRVPPIEPKEASAASGEDLAYMAEWSGYLRTIKLCDPGREAHPCPPLTESE